MLEHVSKEQGAAFRAWSGLQLVKSGLPFTWTQIQRLADLNDSVGAPVRTWADGLGYHSPSNWRYLCHAIKVWQHIDSLGLKEVDIVEIGGGYGGLALYVRGLASLFKTRLRHYAIADLYEVEELQRQVAKVLGVGLRSFDGMNAEAELLVHLWLEDTPRVLVSAYAFSEFHQDTRDWYAERLIRYCDHGLMVWNFPDGTLGGDGRMYGGPVYPFTDRPLTVTADEPNLYDRHQLVRW